MCGITGIFNFGKKPGVIDNETLRSMSSVITHRGPDDSGIYCSEDRLIGMAFRRLSILDLSMSGHQPMANYDKTIWITFNGEIYNHQDLRYILESKGYSYRSHTDTESIIYAYETWGIECIQRFVGMFSMAIWDSQTGTLHLVRDRLGIKPLYYTFIDGAVLFGSEIKSLLKHSQVTKRIDHQALVDYLSFYSTPTHCTMFQDIFKVPPGTCVSINSNGDVSSKHYWNLNDAFLQPAVAVPQSETAWKDSLLQHLRESIQLRMISDVPFGVLLSGGVDSSLNVALMSELMDRPVETFTVGFKSHQQYNELEYAERVSRLFGTNHHATVIDEEAVSKSLGKMAWHMDEPNADPACVPMFFVSELAHEAGTTVVQVGEGADELFSGYHHYLKELRYFKYYYNLPQPLLHFIKRIFSALMPYSRWEEYANRASQQQAPFFYGAVPPFNYDSKHRLLSDDFLDTCLSSQRIPDSFFNSTHPYLDHLAKIIYYELNVRLPELLLMRVDKMAMASSIEARVPFLDHRLVSFALSIPNSLKVKRGTGKYILKRLAEDFLPKDIIYRPKKGLNSPISFWLRSGPFAAFARDTLHDSKLLKDHYIFNQTYISELITSHTSHRTDNSKQLWSLLILALWHNQYFE